MASVEPSTEEPSPVTPTATPTPTATATPTAKRKRKLSVRLGDLGEAKSSSKGSRASKSTSPGTGNQTETPDSGAKLAKRVHTDPAVDNSENRKRTPDSKSKGSKRPKRLSIKTTANNSGTEKQMETPNSGSKHASTKPSKGAKGQKKTPDSDSKGPKRPKSTSTKTTANNSAEYNQGTNQNGGAGLAEMGGIHGWLNQLGLGRYAQVFDKHEVDVEVLPIITLDDLREMGISAVGAKRKLYDAIQKLKEGL